MVYKRIIDLLRSKTRRNGLYECYRQRMNLEVIQEEKKYFLFLVPLSTKRNTKLCHILVSAKTVLKDTFNVTFVNVCMHAPVIIMMKEGRIYVNIHAVAVFANDQSHLAQPKPPFEGIGTISSSALTKTSDLRKNPREKLTQGLFALGHACRRIEEAAVPKAMNDHLQIPLQLR